MRRLPRVVALTAAILAGCRAPAEPVSWRLLGSPTEASLRGLAAVDEMVAFVGGAGGTLLATGDGGRSWRDIAPPDCGACDFRDLEAFDRDNVLAMVAGEPARVYRTADGGRSWRVVHEDPRPAAFFDALAFAGDRGVLFGDAIDGVFQLFRSDDEGRTWRAAAAGTLPEPGAGEAAFAASGTCVVAAGDGARFVMGTGGGPCRFFSFAPGSPVIVSGLPLASGAPSRGAFSVAASGDRVVVVGGDYREPERRDGTAAHSDDGGSTWTVADALGYRSAVVWLDGDRLLAVGSHGASVSRDGGRTWQAFGDSGFHALARGGDGSVWACGSDGRIARLVFAP